MNALKLLTAAVALLTTIGGASAEMSPIQRCYHSLHDDTAEMPAVGCAAWYEERQAGTSKEKAAAENAAICALTKEPGAMRACGLPKVHRGPDSGSERYR